MKYCGTYRLSEFMRPEWFPGAYSIEQAIGVYRWMVATGASYTTREKWGHRGVAELLSTTSALNTSMRPLASIADLRLRFQYALFGRGNESIDRWRADFGIHVDKAVDVPFRHYKKYTYKRSDRDVARLLDGLLGASGRLGIHPNEYHPTAQEIHGVELHAHRGGYAFDVVFGLEGSRWWRRLARSRYPDEAFLDVFERALEEMQAIREGSWVEYCHGSPATPWWPGCRSRKVRPAPDWMVDRG